ncbi:SgcJ/EcaC family oxidoreductase [Micromonospora sp. M12]
MSHSERTADLAAIAEVMNAIARAWDAADADAFGRSFTEDASYVTFVGTLYRGRADITEGHRALFHAFTKGTRMASETLSTTFLGPDIAVVVGRATPTGPPPTCPFQNPDLHPGTPTRGLAGRGLPQHPPALTDGGSTVPLRSRHQTGSDSVTVRPGRARQTIDAT